MSTASSTPRQNRSWLGKPSMSSTIRFGVWIVSIAYVVLYVIHSGLLDFFLTEGTQNVVFVIALLAALVGVYDVKQTKHSVLRNYPVIGHFRWLFEGIRPEIRQYLIEADDEALPFTRSQRSLIYQRAKAVSADKPFGTIVDVYQSGYEFMVHSITPASHPNPEDFRIQIGNEQCTQPYSTSVFNISAMSFGSLSANAILALNQGAARGRFYHDTGEGSISPYHLQGGGDLVWELGSGYFGCRTDEGKFDPEKFAKQAVLPNVKMIEIKMSQGAKPGHGGILPKEKITEQIAQVRGVPRDRDCVSPASHSAFTTPLEMMAFIRQLRELSGGKPVGFKLCIGQPWEFMAIVKAMLATDTYPDYIVVDGAEGGTGAAPIEFTDHLGTPLREGLLFVHNTLVGAGIRDKVKVGASGKIVSAFDIARTVALGADWVNSARGFMFALGCIQSQSCHTNRCPTGVATQDENRQKALVVGDKSERVYHFHHNTLKALADMIAAAGLTHPEQIRPEHLVVRISEIEIKNYRQMHYYMRPSELVSGQTESPFYARMWGLATAEHFQAQTHSHS